MTDKNDAVDSREKLEVDLKTRLYEFGGYCFSSREGHTDNVDTFFDDFVSLLDRQGAITEREMQAKVDELTAERDAKADLLATAFERVKELEAERDDAVEAYDAHMAAHDAWHEAEDITYTRNRFAIYEQATKERIARLESERDEWKTKCNAREFAYKQADAERERYSEQIDELMAERDRLESQIRQLEGDLKGARTSRDHWRHVAGKHAAEMQRLKKALKAANEYGTIWPTFEDGAPVRFGDEIEWRNSGNPKAVKVSEIRFERCLDGNIRSGIRSNSFTYVTRAIGAPYKRPKPRGADGLPIEVGQTVYGEDGKAWVISGFLHGEKYSVEGCTPDEHGVDIVKRLKPEWLTHEKPDSFEEIIDCAEQLTMLTGIGPAEFEALVERCNKVAERIAKEAGR